MAKTTKSRTALNGLPKRLGRVQAQAEKAVTRGVAATLELLPPATRKTVRAFGGQLEDAAADLRARGRHVARSVEQRRSALAGRVERTVAQLEKRRSKAFQMAERRGSGWLEALEAGATRAVKSVASRLDLASARDVKHLGKRLATLERKLGSKPARSRAA